MKTLITLLLSGLMAVNTLPSSAPKRAENPGSGLHAYATVAGIGSENLVALDVSLDDEYYIKVDVPQMDFITPKGKGDRFGLSVASGKFYTSFYASDCTGERKKYHQFRSDDNTVWWALTADEIGLIPDNETEYTIIYYDNGTTAENKPCDCLPEWECECERYDDIFIGVIVEKYGNILSVEDFKEMTGGNQL